MKAGFLVLESGDTFKGLSKTSHERAGEVVFNTSHSGYEEMATDPSYYSQILVATAPMQGNYGASPEVWESNKLWIHGFICLQMQNTDRENSWLKTLDQNQIPVVTELDTRRLVLKLRDSGTVWGAVVVAESEVEAQERAQDLIEKQKKMDMDWVNQVSRQAAEVLQGEVPSGPSVAVLDFGSKNNILRELQKRCSEVKVFPARTSSSEIKDYNPDGILLSNGPGDPNAVEGVVETVKDLLGWKFIFGICMGHQILARALSGRTYKLRFGHRGSNHPICDTRSGKIYMSSQNHGYAIEQESLPKEVVVTHTNLNDGTVSGIQYLEKKCMAVQFHPESHPGPHEAEELFDEFISRLR